MVVLFENSSARYPQKRAFAIFRRHILSSICAKKIPKRRSRPEKGTPPPDGNILLTIRDSYFFSPSTTGVDLYPIPMRSIPRSISSKEMLPCPYGTGALDLYPSTGSLEHDLYDLGGSPIIPSSGKESRRCLHEVRPGTY